MSPRRAPVTLGEDKTREQLLTELQDLRDRLAAACDSEEARSWLAAIVDSSDDAIIGKTLEGTITSWNKAAERLYGYSAAEAVGGPIGIIVPPDRMQELEEILDKVRRGEHVERYETVRVAKDGRSVDVSVTVSPILDASGTVVGASTIARDITGRKRDEKERGVMVEFLSLVNEARSTRELVQKTVTFFQRSSDCEAVGIRLPEGDDYPYYEARGFSPEFIRKENLLCTRDEHGRILRDEDGVPTLECMCGNIISGRFDSSRTFFTANGSFWTNSSSELLATATEKDLLTKTRNACIYEGYESMALIPLRVGVERLGVLQLNDRQKGRFTLEQVAMWERLANYLAVALAKFRADDVLRSSESKFRTLLENAGVAIFIADRVTGEILDCNAKAECLTGRPHNEIIGQHQTMLHPPGQAEAYSEMFARHANADVTTDYEAVVQHRDGRVIPVIINAAPVTVNGRDVMIGFFIDITERKRAEEELLESEEKFRALAESSTAAIIVYQGEWLVSVNPAAERITGYSKDELLEMRLIDIIHPDYKEVVLKRARARQLGKPEPTQYETKIITLSGEARWVLLSVGLMTYRGKPAGVVTLLDITELKRAEEAIHKSDAHLTRSQAIAHLGSFEWDFVNGEDEWSDELYRIFGVMPGAAKPSLETYMSFVYPDDREVVRKHAENILKSHRYPGGYEVRIVRPDGKIRWIRLDGELVRDEAGGAVRLLGMMADITERKRAEEALKAAKMQAELYVDLMCHDISNMNQVGLGFLEMALDLLDLDEMGREMLLKPKSAFEGSTKLIDNVRKLKKAMSGEYLDREMDLGQVLGNVRDYYLKQHGSNISIKYAMNIGYAVKANELLFDVFSNLIGNSIKHSRGHPIIGITIESVRENSIDYYKVAIDDHGPGILDELKATIFDRKLMGDTKSKGSGIGLLLVKTLVDSYKGRVWVEDRMPGDHTKGARFIVLLPAVDG